MFFSGKNVIVTGARTGIGHASLVKFVENGANVWAILRKEDNVFSKEIEELEKIHGVWICPVYCDLSNENEVKDGMKQVLATGKNIDVLVNAAGMVGENRLFQMTKITDMKAIFDVNFFAAMTMTQLVLRRMSRQRCGSIVNVASIAGIDGDPGQMEYSASKAALICATKKLAYELGNMGIRVNAVAPGTTETKMINAMADSIKQEMVAKTALGRTANPSEIADAILYLASDNASYITGQTLRVDGGIKVNSFK